jgi:hypothetical protein
MAITSGSKLALIFDLILVLKREKIKSERMCWDCWRKTNLHRYLRLHMQRNTYTDKNHDRWTIRFTTESSGLQSVTREGVPDMADKAWLSRPLIGPGPKLGRIASRERMLLDSKDGLLHFLQRIFALLTFTA